ncbi:MAG: anthranilate phosphoribosyltransferase [Desulfobacterales bacterium]|nr:anthranilate phosphoribosyltransferase [Desulfobacterales bacterium]MBF0396527.1 anthranilate phosphoribosyltransferase [Desulfobacterales bacterium]
MFRENLNKIVKKKNLTETEMGDMITEIFSGQITDAQVGAFMASLATKGETFEELAGAARAMRRKALRVQVSSPIIVDTCGTGGDGAHTFNISTTTAFVVAGAGVTVAKHGNRSISSKCGSADLLEALSVKIDTLPEIMEEAINKIGIGFFFAPVYHGAMKFAAKARKEIGIRSIFNMLGPLSNPAGANCQLLGVYSGELTEMFALSLRLLGAKRAFVVHGHDGLDEVSVCAPTRVSELKDNAIRTYDILPEQFFGEKANPDTLIGGDKETNAQITKNILSGETGPRRNVILLNASLALVAAGKANDFNEGIKLSEISIDSGSALKKLDELAKYTIHNG